MNKRKVTYIAGFIALAWVVVGAIMGIFMALAHCLKDTTTTVFVVEAIIYTGLFGFLASQIYNVKHRRDGWPSERDDRGWGRGDNERAEDDEDTGSGWRRG